MRNEVLIPALRRHRSAVRARALSGIAAIIGCLVLVLAPVALLPAPLGPTAAALPAADAPPADGRVSVSVDSLAPEVLASGQDLQISGTIVNGTDEPLESVDLVVQVQRSTEIALSGLESWLADEGDAQLSTVITAGLSSIEPGATTTFAVTVPAKDLPLSGSAEWGPRGVQVSVTEDGQSLARDRTIVVWDAGVAVSPTRVTVVVPVVASPAEMNLLAQGDKADPAAVKALRTRPGKSVIAAALLGDPGVLLFDEPVNGLDPEGVKWVRETCRRLAGEGRTVFISSHLMSEMAQTADHLLVIGRGRILTAGPVDDVIASATTDRVRVASPQATQLAELMASRNLAARPVAPNVLETTATTAATIGELAAQGGIVLHELTTIHASLEEAYLNLTSDSVEYRTDPTHQDVPQSQNRAA